MKGITAIILAAGRGTRMKSACPKVLHEMLGKPMINHIIDILNSSGIDDIIIVGGYGSDLLKEAVSPHKVVIQKELLGSGDAIQTARTALGKLKGDLLVICGDTPLIRPETIKRIIDAHTKKRSSATVLTVHLDDPTGYGRIVRAPDDTVSAIVEEVAATECEKALNEINVGTYCFDAADLFDALDQVKPNSVKKEYFLTDVFGVLRHKHKRVDALVTDDADESIGVNTRRDLSEATAILKKRVIESLMDNGVTIVDPSTTIIYPDVRIGKDTTIYPHTIIESNVSIGEECAIGPFTRIRPGVKLADNVEVGNFVELVRTEVGKNTKVKHHTYLGDAIVGADVNIGAGVITANFDGRKKHRTVIKDKCFIGIGARLVAPVTIGKLALVGAGAVVLKGHNVRPGSVVAGVPAKEITRKRS